MSFDRRKTRGGRLPKSDGSESIGDQPMVVIGKTPTGLVYSDPSFSSSLGYGLELSDAEFLTVWQAASTPGQALALSLRPAPLARDAHIRVAEPPPFYARVLPVAEPPTLEATPAPRPVPRTDEPIAAPPAGAEPEAAAAVTARTTVAAAKGEDRSWWVIVLGAGVAVCAALLVRRRRARRSILQADRVTATRPPAGR